MSVVGGDPLNADHVQVERPRQYPAHRARRVFAIVGSPFTSTIERDLAAERRVTVTRLRFPGQMRPGRPNKPTCSVTPIPLASSKPACGQGRDRTATLAE
jgi:hypothetical protein